MSAKTDRIKELEKQIEELRSRWPAHSVKPAMIQRLDELEEELEKAREEAKENEDE
jgi:ATP phosphoribosyltransferase regulatory subunit HisZ